MVVQKFVQNLINSGIFRLYTATGFFASTIFFIVNAGSFTPMEMIFGVVLITIALKGISNIMLSLLVTLYDLSHIKDEIDFQYNSDKITALLSELSVNETRLKEKQAS